MTARVEEERQWNRIAPRNFVPGFARTSACAAAPSNRDASHCNAVPCRRRPLSFRGWNAAAVPWVAGRALAPLTPRPGAKGARGIRSIGRIETSHARVPPRGLWHAF